VILILADKCVPPHILSAKYKAFHSDYQIAVVYLSLRKFAQPPFQDVEAK
jgi:hypothetical protein